MGGRELWDESTLAVTIGLTRHLDRNSEGIVVYANGRARRGSYQRPANVHLSDKAACARWTA